MRLAVILSILLSSTVQAQILPDNDLHLEDDYFRITNESMTEAKFNDIIDRTIEPYLEIFKLHDATFTVDRKWDSSTVNASAIQSGKKWKITMYGGLARRSEVTDDGFALVICHELGHHLGGFPFYGSSSWAAAVEGQSDFFATQACARVIWGKDSQENAKHADTVDPVAKAGCDEAWSNEADRNLCYRAANGGKSLASLLAKLGDQDEPAFDKPDQNVVKKTFENHPKGQCRLDTYFMGALCNADFDTKVIPGKENKDGKNSESAEKEAAATTCAKYSGHVKYNRPACWFKERVAK